MLDGTIPKFEQLIFMAKNDNKSNPIQLDSQFLKDWNPENTINKLKSELEAGNGTMALDSFLNQVSPLIETENQNG